MKVQGVRVLAVLTMVLLGSGVGKAGQAADRLDLHVVLHGALFRGAEPDAGCPSLMLELTRTDDVWQRVWGTAGDYGKSCHHGRVVRAKVTEQRIEMLVVMNIMADSWTRGSEGRAKYAIELMRNKDGSLSGTYAGTFHGAAVKGKADGSLKPAYEHVGAYPAVQPGEHPRILFRAEELPALRAKARTAFGRAALAKMSDAAGLALKYQLTGDRQYAERAKDLARELMANRDHGSKVGRSRPWGRRAEQVALAYDMCYDAWEADFRREVEEYFVEIANLMFYRQAAFDVHIHWHIASPYPAPILYGAAIGGLAIWGEQGPAPAKPVHPYAGRKANPTIESDEGHEPGKGAPVSAFEDGEMPGEWIYVGGYKPEDEGDFRRAAGGLRPEVGDTLSFAGRTEKWRAISHEPDKGYWSAGKFTDGKVSIDITNAIGRVYHSTSLFYTVVRNERRRWVQIRTGYDHAAVYLNGVLLENEDYAEVEAGPVRMMVVARIGETKPWGRIWMRPRLHEVTQEEAEAGLAATEREYADQVADWRFDVEQWKRMGGADVRYMKVFEHGRHWMYLYYREAVGTGGYQAGSYSTMSMEGPGRYATAYRTMFGRDVSPYPDITHYVPRKMFCLLYGEDGEILSQDINGLTGLRIDEYAEGRDMSGEYIGAMYPIVPQRWRPAVLWAWNRHTAVDGEADVAAVLADGNPVFTFVHYPLDVEPHAPQGVMPLAWEAPGHGFYGFRSRWQDTDDFLVQVYGKTHYSGGAFSRDNAGTFRVLGLGEVWSHGRGKPMSDRFGENVVIFPEDWINESACGRLVYASSEADGSGVVTFDMRDVYATSVRREDGTRPNLYERYGDVRRDSVFRDSGITGLRSIGVDYSGACGAPLLMVVVDKITGGGEKVWTWQLDSQKESIGRASEFDKETGIMVWQGRKIRYDVGKVIGEQRSDIADDPSASVRGNTFTIRRGDATLRGTFIVPTDVNLRFGLWTRDSIGFKRHVIRSSSRAVMAEGDGQFFTIITVQDGKAPEVEVDGSGLDARVMVGGQRVRFEEDRVVFGR